jgi:hypothetical protein
VTTPFITIRFFAVALLMYPEVRQRTDNVPGGDEPSSTEEIESMVIVVASVAGDFAGRMRFGTGGFRACSAPDRLSSFNKFARSVRTFGVGNGAVAPAEFEATFIGSGEMAAGGVVGARSF